MADAGALLLSRERTPPMPTLPLRSGTLAETELAQSVAKLSTLNDSGVTGLVTGAPSSQGFRSAKHTPQEWNESNYQKYYQSFSDRDNAERVRHESKKTAAETAAQTQRTQQDSTKKLEERIHDIHFWKEELNREIDEIRNETDLLCAQKKRLENALDATDVPLMIAQDNLRCRARRREVDLVQDNVELQLNKEVSIIMKVRDLLQRTIAESDKQIKLNRGGKHKLTMDWSDKLEAFRLDEKCASLNNNSTDIQYHEGSAKFEEIASDPESWAKFSHDNIVRAEHERMASIQLRNLIDNILTDTSNDMREQCNTVDSAFAKRVEEVHNALTQMQNHLKKVIDEVADMEKNINDLKQAIKDKEAPMKVAQTRLHIRTGRPNVELCRDPAQYKLIGEVGEIQQSIDNLTQRLADSEASLKDLMDTRMTLEKEITVKKNSLFVDKDKCMTTRTRYPTTSKLVGYQ
ncbi:tektin-4-like [Saccoglossus kowalevskii]|uniref:Tektin n=1 Tax=Saccoglossus kowalevskii TaxID=10224 RepID=A0ABM0LYN8_SACKO|nr:PREDICTED: tektin-4-like [Saccoglossus kowalevskii]